MRLIGNMGFVNVFRRDRGFLFDANFKRVKSNYSQLKSILPNILGNSLPSHFSKLGTFNLSGLVKVTPDHIDTTLEVESEIGTTISDLQLTNIKNIDTAVYSGEVEFVDVDLGSFANNPKLGKVSLKADVSGSGFKIDNINTSFVGTVYSIYFNGYSLSLIHI